MALANSRLLPPDVELTRALCDYEAILSDEQRQQFRMEGMPDTRAVVQLTTAIDEQCNDRRSRCMGPRITLFLESIQQLSPVIETFVSSHPERAALVWGGVKLMLLVIQSENSSGMTADVTRLRTMYPRTLTVYRRFLWKLGKHTLA